MNFDLDTDIGMANAKAWTNNHLNYLTDHGTWLVPRSGTIVQIDRPGNVARIVSMLPDPSIARVLKECGWKVEQTV